MAKYTFTLVKIRQIHPCNYFNKSPVLILQNIFTYQLFHFNIPPRPSIVLLSLFCKTLLPTFSSQPSLFCFFASPSPPNCMINWPLTLVHCCTMSLCYLGAEMIITEIQISIQRSSGWATNNTPGPQLFLFCKLTILFHPDPTHSHSIAFLPPCSPL